MICALPQHHLRPMVPVEESESKAEDEESECKAEESESKLVEGEESEKERSEAEESAECKKIPIRVQEVACYSHH